MPPRKTGPKLKKAPQTAQEKAARANLVAAEQATMEQTGTRISTQSRGAFEPRRLRSGGTELQRYSLGSYKDDPFPKFGTTGGGASPTAPTSGTATKRTVKKKAKKDKKPFVNAVGGRSSPSRTKDDKYVPPKNRAGGTSSRTRTKDDENEEARKRREAVAKKKAAAAKRKKEMEAGRGVVRPPTGGRTTMS